MTAEERVLALEEKVSLLMELIPPSWIEKSELQKTWNTFSEGEKVEILEELDCPGIEFLASESSKNLAQQKVKEAYGTDLDCSRIPHTYGELWSISALNVLLGRTKLEPKKIEALPKEPAYIDL